jgi:hypothetical protein
MKRPVYWVIVAVVLVALAALVGWAATYSPLYSPSASEDWSRGRILGVTPVSVAVDIQLMPEGGVLLTWVDVDERLHVVQVGTRGQIVADRMPGLGAEAPREPRLLVGPGGEIHLVWLETVGGGSEVKYARLSDLFAVQAGPISLSLPGDASSSPHMAFNRQGEIEVFWVGEAGLYHVTLDAAGTVQDEAAVLAEEAEDVDVEVDAEGIFHLAWLEESGANTNLVWYACFNPEPEELSQPTEMGRVFLRSGQRVESLAVGMDSNTGYVVWALQDLRDVTSRGWFAFFPLDLPGLHRVSNLELDEAGNPLGLWVVRGPRERVLVALGATVVTEDGPQMQIAIIALGPEQAPASEVRATLGGEGTTAPLDAGGWVENQYVVTSSERPALKPSLAVDAQGELHLAWLETGGFGVYRVAYASTASGVREAYNAITLWDVVDSVFGVAMRLFMVVGLTPVLAIAWIMLPMLWLIGYHFATGQETFERLGARVALGVAVFLELLSTYLVNPYRSSMPAALQWSSPIITTALGLLLAWAIERRRDEASLFGAFFIFALAHGFLQVAVFVLVRW